MDAALDIPVFDDEPSYLEVGLWGPEVQSLQITGPLTLNRTLSIADDVLRFLDPITDCERVFRISKHGGMLLSGLRDNAAAITALPETLRERLVATGVLTTSGATENRRQSWRVLLTQVAAKFGKTGYVELPPLLSPLHLAWLRLRYRRMLHRSELRHGDRQTPHRWTAHNESAARISHLLLSPIVSDIVGIPTKPSYVYLGCYETGALLPEHVDREQCEFTLTLLVDYLPEPYGKSPWPLHLRTASELVTVRQKLGESLLFKGRELPHFRDALPDNHSSTSLFFHFVPADFQGELG